MTKTKFFNFRDFSGGVNLVQPPSLVADNELVYASGCYWDGSLKEFPGSKVASNLSGIPSSTIHCGAHVYMSDGYWYHVFAVKDGTAVEIWGQKITEGVYGAASQVATPGNPATFSYTGSDADLVQCVVFGDKVVFYTQYKVNLDAQNPLVVYYDGGLKINSLEAYDTRDRADEDWYAGQYTESGPVYADDTTAAQTDANDFDIATSTTNDGFYVAGVFTFDKFTIQDCPQFDNSADAKMYYYAGNGTWTEITYTIDVAWTGAAGDKVVSIVNYTCYDWVPIDGDVTGTTPSGDTFYGRYVLLMKFSTAPTGTMTADRVKDVQHTKYLTQLTSGERPSSMVVHNNRLFIAHGSVVHYTPYNQITGWRDYEVEYFRDGGETITSMVSGDALYVFKEGAVYAFYGSSYEELVLRKLTDSVGSQYPDKRAISSRGYTFFMSSSDLVYAIRGELIVPVTSHFHSQDVPDGALATAKTGYPSFVWNGFVFMYPGTSNSQYVCFNPDTIKTDGGTGKVSCWPAPSILRVAIGGAEAALPPVGVFAYSSGKLYNYLSQPAGNSDTGTVIQNGSGILFWTKDYDFDMPYIKKAYGRFRYGVVDGRTRINIARDRDDENMFSPSDTFYDEVVQASVASTASSAVVTLSAATVAQLEVDMILLSHGGFFTKNAVGEAVRITDITGTSVTFSRAAKYTYTGVMCIGYKTVSRTYNLPHSLDGERLQFRFNTCIGRFDGFTVEVRPRRN